MHKAGQTRVKSEMRHLRFVQAAQYPTETLPDVKDVSRASAKFFGQALFASSVNGTDMQPSYMSSVAKGFKHSTV